MDVNRLLSDELTFELRCRGVDIGNGTVNEKRNLLREALRKEHLGINAPINVDFEPKSEINICSNKLDDLLGNIQEFNIANKDNDYKRIKSRLLHVQGRINRINTTELEVQTEKNKLYDLCIDLMRALDETYAVTMQHNVQGDQNQDLIINEPDQAASISLIDQPNLLLPEIVHSQVNNTLSNSVNVTLGNLLDVGLESQASPERSSQIAVPPHPVDVLSHSAAPGDNSLVSNRVNKLAERLKSINLSNCTHTNENVRQRHVHFDENFEALNSTSREFAYSPCSYPAKYVDVTRWKLRFDGTSSVTDFLECLEEMRVSRNVSKTQLFNSISELLEGDAAVWFRFARDKIRNYDEFREYFRTSFLPKNYEERVREILKHRTQATTESVVIYVAHMENLFSKLQNKPTEESRVSFIKSKMLPHLQMALAGKNILTLESLIKIGREIEEARVSAQEYQAPPINPRNSVEPGLEYRRPSSRLTVVDSRESEDLIDFNQPSVASTSVQAVAHTVKCWNCGQQGHVRYNCSQPPRKLCYRCGKHDVTIRTCPACTGNGQRNH